MSSKSTPKRCIIQKLDFENCIVTNFKTTTRGRKKLRARITREVEQISSIPVEEKPLNRSPTPTQPSSPVLIKKHRESPVFSKRKNQTPEKTVDELFEDSTTEPSSPVFKSFKKQKRDEVSRKEFQNVLGRMTSLDMFQSQGSSSSDLQSSYQIEDFTQESKQSVKISSVDSAEVKKDTDNADGDSVVSFPSPVQLSERFNLQEKFESPKSFRRNYKKNSLLGRLHKLQKKQASEKLLWQHQNRKISSASLKLSINSFWKEEFNYFLKCQSVESDSEETLLIVDCRWIPNIKTVKEGSVLLVHPPWQKLTMEGSAMSVLLNLICLDVLDEIKKPVVRKKTTEAVPTDVFETNQKLFVDSLFSSSSGFFW